MLSRIKSDDTHKLEAHDEFHEDVRDVRRFFLMPAQLPAGGQREQAIESNPALRMRHLSIRPAWQIGENDPDIVALDGDEDPFIPDGVTDAPVIKSIAAQRARRSVRSDS